MPLSTLSNQMNRPKFTIETLYALAEALGLEVHELLPHAGSGCSLTAAVSRTVDEGE